MVRNLLISFPEGIVFIGHFSDNRPHRHYALQVSIALSSPFEIVLDQERSKHWFCALKPNVLHQADCLGSAQMIVLINPASELGHYLQHHALSKDVTCFLNEWSEKLKELGSKLTSGELTQSQFSGLFSGACENFSRSCRQADHQTDDRVLKALQFMEKEAEKIFSLKEVAQEVCLSESRFLHLFKEQTGLTFRRMQLWQKLNKAITLYFQEPGLSLTELAHTSGFADSAHFSRIFKENFGLAPSSIIQASNFLPSSE